MKVFIVGGNGLLGSKAAEVRMFPEIISDLKIWTPSGPDAKYNQC